MSAKTLLALAAIAATPVVIVSGITANHAEYASPSHTHIHHLSLHPFPSHRSPIPLLPKQNPRSQLQQPNLRHQSLQRHRQALRHFRRRCFRLQGCEPPAVEGSSRAPGTASVIGGVEGDDEEGGAAVGGGVRE